MGDLIQAAQGLGIRLDQLDHLLQQIGIGHQLTAAEIDQAGLEAVAHGAPAVLVDQEGLVAPPGGVHALEPPQHADQADIQRRHRHRVLDARADIADAHLQRREPGTRPDVPPDLGAVLDHPDLDQGVQVLLVLAEAHIGFGDAGARQLVEDGQPIGLQVGHLALPERRRRGQHQEMGQEVADLVHQIDAEIRVLDADMDMHGADQQPPHRHADILLELLVALPLRGLLGLPGGKGMGRGGDHLGAMGTGDLADAAAQADQVVTGLGDAAADRRPDLDLGPHELGRHPRTKPALALGHDVVGRVGDEIACHRVDEKVFLLDTDGELRCHIRHGQAVTRNRNEADSVTAPRPFRPPCR